MKNWSLLLVFSLIFCAVAFMNFRSSDVNQTFIMSFMNEEPQLPDVPFPYSEVEFPEHLLNNDEPGNGEDGYSSGPIDPAAFEDLTDDGATLGRVLFYDEKLSALENISCASCHKQELSFADDVALSQGVNTPTKRNSMALNDIAWSNNNSFFWDMSHNDILEMIVLPLRDDNEIGAEMPEVVAKLEMTEYYPTLFENAFGDAEITEERIANALVQFIESMVTFNSKFDEGLATDFANFNEQELWGKELFAIHCTTCHTEGGNPFAIIDFGEHEFEAFPFIFNNGLIDEDDAGTGEWHPELVDLFKIPNLRNVSYTAPYMHDGRFETLEEVLDHYSEGVEENEWTSIFIPGTGFGFGSEEKDALIAFMETLSDESFLEDEKWSDPFDFSSSVSPDLASAITMYPNPMSSHATIQLQDSASREAEIIVRDSEGAVVRTDRMVQGTYDIYKQDLKPGTYFVEIQNQGQRSVQKLVVQ